jgi:hypothetical protein
MGKPTPPCARPARGPGWGRVRGRGLERRGGEGGLNLKTATHTYRHPVKDALIEALSINVWPEMRRVIGSGRSSGHRHRVIGSGQRRDESALLTQRCGPSTKVLTRRPSDLQRAAKATSSLNKAAGRQRACAGSPITPAAEHQLLRSKSAHSICALARESPDEEGSRKHV